MKEDNNLEVRICPKCGREYTGIPSLSREDNETQICPDCGIRESLTSLGIGKDEQERILEDIHRYECTD